MLLRVAAAGLAAGMLVVVLPRVVGTTRAGIGAALGLVTLPEALVLTLLWAGGLLVHSFVLTAALPGLSRRRALTLNLTGSAVSNVLPFGGAAGMSTNYAMVRSWRFAPAAFASYTLVTNVWVVLLKLSLPAAALVVLMVARVPVSPSLRWWVGASVAGLVVVAGVLVAGLVSRRAAQAAARRLGLLVAGLTRVVGRPADGDATEAGLLASRDRVVEVVTARWPRLSLAMAGYGAAQALLLWGCLHAVGAGVPPAQALAGFAVERLMTLAVLTPGGAGVAEAGTAAALVLLGAPPAATAAGVLLYRGFTFALEIPVGGAWLAGWLVVRRWSAREVA